MSDYIKREDAIRSNVSQVEFCKSEGLDFSEKLHIDSVINNLKHIPAADVVERKTGKWIEFSWIQGSTATGATISRMYKCSVCGGLFGRKDDRFCYNCGARMVTDDV